MKTLDIFKFIKPELLVLVPVLSIVGAGIKKSAVKNMIDQEHNQHMFQRLQLHIPYQLSFVGILFL